MQFATASLALSALLAAGLVAAQNGLSVATLPSITTCIPNRLTWTGGAAPYNVFVIVPQQSSQILQSLGSTNDNFLVYTPNGETSGVRPGDTVAIYVVDAQGVNNGSAGTQVISGGTCAGAGSSSTTTSGAAAPTTSASTSASAPVETVTTSRSTGTTPRPSSSTTPSSTPSASPTGAAAPGLKVSGGLIAGVVGLLAAALV